MIDGVSIPWGWLQRRHKADPAASTLDQTASDADQSASDMDQSVSDRDQSLADADELASGRDQAASDRDLATRPGVTRGMQQAHDLGRSERAASTIERHAATSVRAEVSGERDQQALQRDEIARQRDTVAEERDRAAEEHDQESEQQAEALGGPDLRAIPGLEALAKMRTKAAAMRAQAAADRERASRDREAAAKERELLLAELDRAHLDDLTGAYRRGTGETALANEIHRVRRSQETLVLAFVDCDGLKAINDREGHAAGDALLGDLVASLRSGLRPYDPVVRWGGDEFVCAVSDADEEHLRGRFEQLGKALAEGHPDASITVGLATLREEDTLETLLERADVALLKAKRER
jgi:diguanylate cyclase (GGDEF)-like protein